MKTILNNLFELSNNKLQNCTQYHRFLYYKLLKSDSKLVFMAQSVGKNFK